MLPRVKKEEDRKVALGFDNVKSLVTLPGGSEFRRYGAQRTVNNSHEKFCKKENTEM